MTTETAAKVTATIEPTRFGHYISLHHGTMSSSFIWRWGSAQRAERVARRKIIKRQAELDREAMRWTVEVNR